MKRLLKDERRIKICIPIVETTIESALRSMKKANTQCDLIEIRRDYLRSFDFKSFFSIKENPIIFTNRKKEEGGRWEGSEKERFMTLKEAIRFGVDYVDIELRSEKEELLNLLKNKRGVKIIISYHDFEKTPSTIEIQRIFEKANEFRPDIVKIVTYARSYGDNLRILSLIPYAKKRGKKALAFTMGQKGRISRIVSPILGAAWTYASINDGKRSAPGQLTIKQMREVYKILGC